MTKRYIEINKGPLIGGPFDGSEHFVMFFPDDHPEGYSLPQKQREIYTVFSVNFPEGAIYHWSEDKQEWYYVGQMDQDSQARSRQLFQCFNVKPAESL